MATFSKYWIKSTNLAETGTAVGCSGNGNQLKGTTNSKVYSKEANVIAQHWILPDACTGTGLFPDSKDCNGLWSVIKEK